MKKTILQDATRPGFDQVIQDIVDYALDYDVTTSDIAMETARYCWMDTMGCALLALNYPACRKLLGPIVPQAMIPGGARVPGTHYQLDPVHAAWNIGAMLRWLDFNDTWLAAEWGHPSDNLGAILAIADYLSRNSLSPDSRSQKQVTMRDVLIAMIKAYEIQGIIALENSFNRNGLDHVLLVRIASTAVAATLLGCSRKQCLNAVSNAWLDGCALRAYRHAPNTGSRKSWAAGDATARGVFLALLAQRGEMGYPSAITAPEWGFQEVLFKGKTLQFKQAYASYVMENILFKLSFPAEFHAQTAVEAAIILHSQVKPQLEQIKRIEIETQESAERIINKTGPLDNPADRDHCLQYMVAIGLIKGKLSAEDYEDQAAADPLIDILRDKMQVRENKRFTAEYHAPEKRAIGNSVQIFFNDGTASKKIVIDYPIGHRCRRKEGIPILINKFKDNIATILPFEQCHTISEICASQEKFEAISIDKFIALWVRHVPKPPP